MLYIKNMKEILQNKKICIGILVLCILILVGIILGIALKGDGNQAAKEEGGQDIIVHEADKDTVEEKAEGGLNESDSEDGPALNEDNMIDFNGSDVKTEDNDTGSDKTESGFDGNESTDNAGDSTDDDSTDDDSTDDDSTDDDSADDDSTDDNSTDDDSTDDDSTDDDSNEDDEEDDEKDSEDTGSWGIFY